MGNEKLAAVGVRAGVGHGETADLMLAWIVFYFVRELITGTTASGAGGIPALDHEIGNHTMKKRAVVKFLPGEKNEVVNCFWRVFGKEIAHDFPARRLEGGGILL